MNVAVVYSTKICFFCIQKCVCLTTVGSLCLDIISFAWHRVQYSGDAPHLYGMSAALYGDTMLLFGGHIGTNSPLFGVFDS